MFFKKDYNDDEEIKTKKNSWPIILIKTTIASEKPQLNVNCVRLYSKSRRSWSYIWGRVTLKTLVVPALQLQFDLRAYYVVLKTCLIFLVWFDKVAPQQSPPGNRRSFHWTLSLSTPLCPTDRTWGASWFHSHSYTVLLNMTCTLPWSRVRI